MLYPQGNLISLFQDNGQVFEYMIQGIDEPVAQLEGGRSFCNHSVAAE